MPLMVRKNTNSKSLAFGKYYIEVDNADPLTNEGLVDHILHHNCAVGREAIAAVIEKLGECIPELVAQGQPVQINGLGTFYASASSAGASSLAECSTEKLKGIHFRFLPLSKDYNNLTSKRFLEQKVSPTLKYVVKSELRTVNGEGRRVQVRQTLEDALNPADE